MANHTPTLDIVAVAKIRKTGVALIGQSVQLSHLSCVDLK